MGGLSYILVAAFTGLILLGAPAGYCEERRVTLAEALKIGLEENYELRAEKSSLLAHKEGIGIARSYLLPKLTFEEKATRTNNPPQTFMMKLNQQRFSQADFAIDKLNNPSPTNDFQTSFLLEQPVFTMKSLVGLSMAKNAYAAKSDEFRRKREETALRIVQAYLRVHTARGFLNVAGQGIENAKEHLRIAEVRSANGLGLYSDLLRARTFLLEAQQALVSSEKEYSVAKRWLGLVLAIPEPVNAADEEVSFNLSDLGYYRDASIARKDLSAMKIRTDNAGKNIKLAESAYFPYVGLSGSYQMNDHSGLLKSEGDSWLVSAYLRWDLFDGTKREFERGKARHEAQEAKEHFRGLKEFISFKVNEAYLAVGETKKNLELARAALIASEEGRRLVKNRYENSLSPMVDLLDVQMNLNRARANALAQENAYKLSIVNLEYESGTIMKDRNVEEP